MMREHLSDSGSGKKEKADELVVSLAVDHKGVGAALDFNAHCEIPPYVAALYRSLCTTALDMNGGALPCAVTHTYREKLSKEKSGQENI